MVRLVAISMLAAFAAPAAALADGGEGGNRMPAGGGHMSSYVSDPYHDPRSAYSQRMGTGQILGAPMLVERPAPTVARRPLVDPHWAVGGAPRPRR